MKVGMPIWYGNRPLEKPLKSAKKLGFDYVEISLDYPWHPNQQLRKQLIELSKEYELDLAFHLPIPELNLCHPSNEISIPAMNTCIKFLKSLALLNPSYINLHLEFLATTIRFKEVWGEAVKKAAKVATKLHSFSKSYNLFLVFENGLFGGIGRKIDDLNFMLRKNLNLCLDLGHAVVVSYLPKQEKLKATRLLKPWIKRFNKIISVIHWHDVALMKWGIEDHLPLGIGEMNLGEIAGFIRNINCEYLLLEIHHSLKNKKIIPAKVIDFKNSLKICRELLD
ncbi:MAG: TIM barrel protein [Candidatus Aenigmarchaeota archaeon]|nr:TIM barrel protein [Candidatus Aenigmarchaeota archaeon]